MVRNVVENVVPQQLAPMPTTPIEAPAHDVEDLLGLIPSDNALLLTSRKSLQGLSTVQDSTNSKPVMGRPWSVVSPTSTVRKLALWPTTGFSFPNHRSKVPTLWSCAVNVESHWCSFKTSRDSWLVRPTRLEVSPKMGRNSSLLSLVSTFQNSPSLSVALMVQAITACVAVLTIQGSSSCGQTVESQ